MFDLVFPLVVIVLAALVWRGVWPREPVDESLEARHARGDFDHVVYRPYDQERDGGIET